MDEEPTLPSFARANPIARRLDELSGSSPRKRARFSPPASSDPPLFSSDDDPSADNYTTKRQKRKYRGPWFRQHPASDPPSDSNENPQLTKGKRTVARQIDSGVFLGSDGTDVEDFAEDLDLEYRKRSEVFENGGAKIVLHPRSRNLFGRVARDEPDPEESARRRIQHCLEEGVQDIILSSLELTSLSNSTISPLITFTCYPKLSAGVTFESLVPDLKIFLGSNRLASLPATLFSLDRLTFLTLRDNRLEELPPGIGRLKNLEVLNVSQNALSHLPYEILELVAKDGTLKSLQLHPNPFYESRNPVEEEAETEEETISPIFGTIRKQPQTGRSNLFDAESNPSTNYEYSSNWQIAYNCRSEVRFRDISGSLLKGPIFPKDSAHEKSRLQLLGALDSAGSNSIHVAGVDDIPVAPASRGTGPSHAPSLLEVALNSCSKTPQLPYLSELLPEDSPKHLEDLLLQASAKKESGGSQCTICQRSFIIPRTEWIEWWEITSVADTRAPASAASPLRQKENERDRVESMVPLMRRGCSWLCVPRKETVRVAHRTTSEGDERSLDAGERTMTLD
ncbi:Leucine-rich repeat-containing protein 57 [Phlyctema vagabunda]|uniref:Leucine-rich repeat-containing protein 57 n=1 Tax=Phlyctema vagabunda TaxID=108571 RepID=A0ABR4P9C5_9HELO